MTSPRTVHVYPTRRQALRAAHAAKAKTLTKAPGRRPPYLTDRFGLYTSATEYRMHEPFYRAGHVIDHRP